MRLLNTIQRNLRNLSKEEAVSNDEIRPFIINQYRRLKLAGFNEEEIRNCVILNDKEREAMNKEFNLLDSTKSDITNSIADLAMNELDNDDTDNNTEEEIVEVEEVKEEKDNKVVLTKEEKAEAKDILPVNDEEEKAEEILSVDNEKEEVKNESKEKSEEVKNESKEKAKVEVKDLTDEEIIDKAIKEQLEVITSDEEKAEMEKILRKSFKENKELVEIYRNKYNATSKFNNTVDKISDSNNNEESEDEGEYVYLSIAPEELEDLINDIKNDYDNDYGVNTNTQELRSIIIDILDKNENILKATTYGELYNKTKDILDNMIDSSTVEIGNDNQDELLKDLNAIFNIK
mgnify:CR=1 FL=1